MVAGGPVEGEGGRDLRTSISRTKANKTEDMYRGCIGLSSAIRWSRLGQISDVWVHEFGLL